MRCREVAGAACTRSALPRAGWLRPAVLLAGCLLSMQGCARSRATLLPAAGPVAHRLSDLGWPVYVGFTAVSVAMALLLSWALVRRRGTFDSHLPISVHDARGWIAVGGIAIPTLVFGVLLVATFRTMNRMPGDQHVMHEKGTFKVTGHQWWWDVQVREGDPSGWFRTANELHIPVGRPIVIELATADVIHSFWVPHLAGKVDLIPGFLNRVRIEADRPGTYPGLCAQFCGLQHANMRFIVVAESPAAYEAWLVRQRQAALTPTAALPRRGQQVFLGAACPLCHTVSGTEAQGLVGPDLSHVASRPFLAAKTLPFDIASLHAWVTNAPSLKPGVLMPALRQFTGDQLGALASYLETLQ